MKSMVRNLTLGLGLALMAAGGAQAAMAPSVGPNPSWTPDQKFEWHIGYMSAASALCRDYNAASQLRDIAALSPYGRMGLNAINFDGFIGGVCAKIRSRAVEMLEKKETYVRILSATYDCSPGGACAGGPDATTAEHACSEEVDEHLDALSLKRADIKSITFSSPPPGPANAGAAPYQARVRMKSCQGSLYVDLGAQCTLKQSYTRGDCEVAGVSGF